MKFKIVKKISVETIPLILGEVYNVRCVGDLNYSPTFEIFLHGIKSIIKFKDFENSRNYDFTFLPGKFYQIIKYPRSRGGEKNKIDIFEIEKIK